MHRTHFSPLPTSSTSAFSVHRRSLESVSATSTSQAKASFSAKNSLLNGLNAWMASPTFELPHDLHIVAQILPHVLVNLKEWPVAHGLILRDSMGRSFYFYSPGVLGIQSQKMIQVNLSADLYEYMMGQAKETQTMGSKLAATFCVSLLAKLSAKQKCKLLRGSISSDVRSQGILNEIQLLVAAIRQHIEGMDEKGVNALVKQACGKLHKAHLRQQVEASSYGTHAYVNWMNASEAELNANMTVNEVRSSTLPLPIIHSLAMMSKDNRRDTKVIVQQAPLLERLFSSLCDISSILYPSVRQRALDCPPRGRWRELTGDDIKDYRNWYRRVGQGSSKASLLQQKKEFFLRRGIDYLNIGEYIRADGHKKIKGQQLIQQEEGVQFNPVTPSILKVWCNEFSPRRMEAGSSLDQLARGHHVLMTELEKYCDTFYGNLTPAGERLVLSELTHYRPLSPLLLLEFVDEYLRTFARSDVQKEGLILAFSKRHNLYVDELAYYFQKGKLAVRAEAFLREAGVALDAHSQSIYIYDEQRYIQALQSHNVDNPQLNRTYTFQLRNQPIDLAETMPSLERCASTSSTGTIEIDVAALTPPVPMNISPENVPLEIFSLPSLTENQNHHYSSESRDVLGSVGEKNFLEVNAQQSTSMEWAGVDAVPQYLEKEVSGRHLQLLNSMKELIAYYVAKDVLEPSDCRYLQQFYAELNIDKSEAVAATTIYINWLRIQLAAKKIEPHTAFMILMPTQSKHHFFSTDLKNWVTGLNLMDAEIDLLRDIVSALRELYPLSIVENAVHHGLSQSQIASDILSINQYADSLFQGLMKSCHDDMDKHRQAQIFQSVEKLNYSGILSELGCVTAGQWLKETVNKGYPLLEGADYLPVMDLIHLQQVLNEEIGKNQILNRRERRGKEVIWPTHTCVNQEFLANSACADKQMQFKRARLDRNSDVVAMIDSPISNRVKIASQTKSSSALVSTHVDKILRSIVSTSLQPTSAHRDKAIPKLAMANSWMTGRSLLQQANAIHFHSSQASVQSPQVCGDHGGNSPQGSSAFRSAPMFAGFNPNLPSLVSMQMMPSISGNSGGDKGRNSLNRAVMSPHPSTSGALTSYFPRDYLPD